MTATVSSRPRAPLASLCVLVLGACCVAVLGARVGSSEIYGPRAPGLAGMWWPDPPRLAPFRLIDQDGRDFDEAALRGAWTLLFFGYTQCPDICPATLALLARACKQLAAEDEDLAPQVLLVSVDAERDSPAALARYVRHFDAGFRAATAPMMELHLLTRQLGADFTRVGSETAGGYGYEHSASIFVVAPDLRVVGELMPPLDAKTLAARVRNIRLFVDARS